MYGYVCIRVYKVYIIHIFFCLFIVFVVSKIIKYYLYRDKYYILLKDYVCNVQILTIFLWFFLEVTINE